MKGKSHHSAGFVPSLLFVITLALLKEDPPQYKNPLGVGFGEVGFRAEPPTLQDFSSEMRDAGGHQPMSSSLALSQFVWAQQARDISHSKVDGFASPTELRFGKSRPT